MEWEESRAEKQEIIMMKRKKSICEFCDNFLAHWNSDGPIYIYECSYSDECGKNEIRNTEQSKTALKWTEE